MTKFELLARAAMQDFVDKCDKGEARSVRSYKAFKEALAAPVAAIQPAGDVAVLRKRVEDAREAAYTFGEYSKEAARLAIEGVLDLIDEWDAERAASAPAQPEANPYARALTELLERKAILSRMEFEPLEAWAFRAITELAAPVPAAPADKGELPELPKTVYLGGDAAYNDDIWGHTDDSMREYGQACILADRARSNSAWVEYLREGETPLARLQREIKDSDSLATLLASARQAAIAQPPKPKLTVPNFTPGTVYQSKSYGSLVFVGMDTFHGQTTFQFKKGHRDRYLGPEVVESEFGA